MEAGIKSLQPNARAFKLCNMQLTVAPHLEHLFTMTSIDLSNNRLCHLDAGYYLQSVREMNLSNNRLADLNSLTGLPCLEVLNIANNGK